MYDVFEGAKQTVEVKVKRRRGTGSITLTSPERRILNSARTVISDWAAATWTAGTDDGVLSALFDSTVTGLTTPGTYYLQFRGVIGVDQPEHEVVIRLKEWGP